jgi:hypothetical protein
MTIRQLSRARLPAPFAFINANSIFQLVVNFK